MVGDSAVSRNLETPQTFFVIYSDLYISWIIGSSELKGFQNLKQWTAFA